MFQSPKANVNRIVPFLKGLFRGHNPQPLENTPAVQRVIPPAMPILSTQKQQELDALCQQLFKKKDLIASGKLQLIGLEKIKERMGVRWDKLSTLVYVTTEDVIRQHLGKGDFFIRYKTDSYVIIFANASRHDAQTKADIIIKEIKQRLFNLNEADLEGIEVRGIVEEMQATQFAQQGFPRVLETVFSDRMPSVAHSETVSADSDLDLSQSAPAASKSAESYTYIPLWDVARGALTTYLCMPQFNLKEGETIFDAYQASYKSRAASDRVQIDLKTLYVVIDELVSMEEGKRRFFVVCPVHHETLSHLEDFQIYKEACQMIPLEQKKFLIFMVIDMPDGLTLKEPYRFIGPLKNFCAHVFAKNILGHKINFQLLKDSGIEGVGVIADKSTNETQTMELLNSFRMRAQACKIGKTFVLGVPSLSLTTSAVCAGYDYLGGIGIHENVEKPDHIYRYRHEDLISGLIEK